VPERYQWVVRLFGFRGTVNQGNKELLSAVNQTRTGPYDYLFKECLFYNTFFQINFKHKLDKEIMFEKDLDSLAPGHILIAYAYGRALMKVGRNDEAIRAFQLQSENPGLYSLSYLNLLLGKAKLNRLDDDANRYLYKYVNNFRGHNYIKEAYQKIAWYYLIHGNTSQYLLNMKKVINYGDDASDADMQALMEAQGGVPPNVELLKARLLFDGGYYGKAEELLINEDIKLKSKKDSVEYSYRLGRIYHSWRKPEKAIKYYKKAIRDGADLPNYYAANAALHLGMLYESKGNNDLARMYYKMCLDMDFKEYRSSIHQRAKAGLSRVKDSS
jgi:tetratricopeptide (TPR) repeat protein